MGFVERIHTLFSAGKVVDSIRGLVAFSTEPLATMVALHQDRTGEIFRMGGRSFLYLSEPEDVEWMYRQRSDVLVKDAFIRDLGRVLGQGLLVSEGEFWRKQRGLMAHAFTPKRVRGYGGAMAQIAEDFALGLRDDAEVDIHDAMNRVTMAIVAKTLFDADVSDRGSEVGVAIEKIMDFFANSPEAVFGAPDWLPTRRMRAFLSARDTVRGIVDAIIRERRAGAGGPVDRGDLLGAMLVGGGDVGATMSDDQLRDEFVTLFLAGHETTSLLLAHTFVLLARHPEVVATLRDEIDSVLGDRIPTADDARALVHTEQVLTEALRIYPSAWAVGRETAIEVERHGRTIPIGTQLIVSPWAIHRDPRFFPRPEAFLPGRWTPEFRKQLPRGAYSPFGDGPRVCIGQHFAMLEAILILAAIVRRVDLELVPGTSLEFAPSVTLRVKRGIRMRVRRASRITAPTESVRPA